MRYSIWGNKPTSFLFTRIREKAVDGQSGQLSFKLPLTESVLFVGAMGQLAALPVAGRTPTVWWADLAMLFAGMIALTRRFPSEKLRDRRTQRVICYMALYVAVNFATLCLAVNMLFSLAVLKLFARRCSLSRSLSSNFGANGAWTTAEIPTMVRGVDRRLL